MLLTEVLVTAYAFVLGACVGSFLNVVAWRLPNRMSLIRPASHCPQCKTPIRLRDNVPVLGWILLRGHCRTCGCRISPRYPLVEFAVGASFALLAWFELATGGSNLPPRADIWKPLAAGLPFDSIYLGVWLYHVTLVSLLATIALVEFDRQRLPRGFYLVALCAALLPPLVWPELRVTFSERNNAMAWAVDASTQQALQSLMYGAVLGTCLAWSFDPRASERRRLLPLATALAATGAFLGDLAMNVVADIVAIALVAVRLLQVGDWRTFERLPWTMFVSLGALGAIGGWRLLRSNPPLYTEKGWQLALILAVCLLLAGVSRLRRNPANAADSVAK